jgi:hypothetical protein
MANQYFFKVISTTGRLLVTGNPDLYRNRIWEGLPTIQKSSERTVIMRSSFPDEFHDEQRDVIMLFGPGGEFISRAED